MTAEEIAEAAARGEAPPDDLSGEVKALWHTKAGRWEDAHDIAQDIDTPFGSWIHAHLHLIEGDIGNAGYWYNRAGKPAKKPAQIEEEWDELIGAALRL